MDSKIPKYLEIEEIENIIIKMSRGEIVPCPNCGTPLKGYENGRLKAAIYCSKDDFQILLDFHI